AVVVVVGVGAASASCTTASKRCVSMLIHVAGSRTTSSLSEYRLAAPRLAGSRAMSFASAGHPNRPKRGMDSLFKPRFSMIRVISQDRERCQFLFCLMKNPPLYRSTRPESGREAPERSLFAPLARTPSERRRRLALPSGFRLLRLSGIDRLVAQGSVAGRGWADGRGF